MVDRSIFFCRLLERPVAVFCLEKRVISARVVIQQHWTGSVVQSSDNAEASSSRCLHGTRPTITNPTACARMSADASRRCVIPALPLS
jgi:hypothetical protein